MSKLDKPASALTGDAYIDCDEGRLLPGMGFTKRERACIDLRIPESGDPQLDALIEKARRQEIAAQIAAGLSAATDNDGCWHHEPDDVADAARQYADAVIQEVECTNG